MRRLNADPAFAKARNERGAKQLRKLHAERKQKRDNVVTNLARALAVRAVTHAEERQGGAQAVARANAITGCYDDHPAAKDTALVYDEIMAVGLADMPPSTDLVSILLETLAVRLDGASRASAWQAIGIKPSRGRELLARNRLALDWPIWYTLREAALGDAFQA